MSEDTNTSQEGQVEQPPKEYTAIEQKAMEMGWRPLEEFEGAEEDFVDAKEYVGRKPLFDKISTQSREVKQLRQAVEALKTHYTAVRETEYNRALAALKAERKTALNEGDGDKFEALTDEIASIEEQAAQIKQFADTPVTQEAQVHPTLQHWINQNPWYTQQEHMRVYADKVGQRLYAQGVAPDEVLRQVSEAVKKEFPTKFRNPNRESAPNVSEGGKQPTKASGGSLSTIEAGLTEQERRIMNNFVQNKVMTKEKYLQDLQAIKKL